MAILECNKVNHTNVAKRINELQEEINKMRDECGIKD